MSTSTSTHVLLGYAVPESLLDYVFDIDEQLYGDEEYNKIDVTRDAYEDNWAYIGVTFAISDYNSKHAEIDLSELDPVALAKTIDTFFPLLYVQPDDIKLHVFPYWY